MSEESLRKLTAAARLARLGYWESDLVANLVSWTEDTTRLLDLPATNHTLSWDGFRLLVHPDDWPKIEDGRTRLTQGEPSHRNAFRLVLEDGDVRHVETIAEGVCDSEGRLTRIVGAIQDVTVRRQLEEALLKSQERLKLALQATGLGPWDWNLKDNVVEFWPEWKRQLGYEPHEISNQYMEWESRLHADDRKRVLTELQSYLEGQKPEYETEFRLRHKNGSYRWIYTRGVVLLDQSGQQTHMFGCHLDITERKQLEEQYRQSNKLQAIGQLAGGIAHDFNNLLVVIEGYAQLVAEHLGPDHKSRGDVDEICAAARSAAALTHRLLAFSRRQVLQPQILDLTQTLQAMGQLLGRLIPENITLDIKPTSGARVSADPGQIEQVIMNLALNARDAMLDGGHLLIESVDVNLDGIFIAQHPGAKRGKHVLISVSDTGVGMDEATLERIFEPFFTTKPVGQGTGLGLATVYGIVRQSNGTISVYSEPGIGTTFRVYLPVASEFTAPQVPRIDARSLRGSETVLVVEDQAGVRKLIDRILSRFGYTVIAAANDGEAMALARGHAGPIHLLLTDVVLPGAGGREIARNVAEEHPSVRVLYMSGYTADAIAQHDVLEPGLAFIEKPFTASVLVRRIREVLTADLP